MALAQSAGAPSHNWQGLASCLVLMISYLSVLLIVPATVHAGEISYNVSYKLAPVYNATNSPGVTADPHADLVQHMQNTRFVIQKVLTPIVVIFGVVGNTINIAVLTQKIMRTSSTNTYLSALAIYDVLYLIFGLTMSFKHYKSIKAMDLYTRYRLPFGKPLVDTFSNSGIWLTLTFTVERYIGVCHPMKGKVLCTPERAQYITIGVCVCAAVITFPEFFEFTVEEKTGPNNSTILSNKYTAFGSASAYQWGYIYMNQALFTFLPLILLLIFNTLLIRAVMAATKRRKSMSNVSQNDRQDRQQREQQKITIMLISVVLVFLMCQLPQAIQNLYLTYLIATKRLTQENRYILIITANVFNLLVMLNSSGNFILYSSFSLKFRRTFKRLFCRCLIKNGGKGRVFSDTCSDGSKTNLILHGSNIRNTSLATTNKNGNQPSFSQGNMISSKSPAKTKNGYLEVQQGEGGGSFV